MSNISVANSTYTTGGIDTRATLDATSDATFQQMNGAASGVIAIETVLGDGPTLRGNMADLVTRLAVSLDANGRVKSTTAGAFIGLTDLYGLIADGTDTMVAKNISPIGKIDIWPTLTAPSHWLLCDGSSLLRADYADLFAVIGTQYGAVDGTHFTLPDLRGRVVVMIDGTANRLTVASTGGGNADALGGVGGSETHTLVTGEIPAHSHVEQGDSAADGTGASRGIATHEAESTVSADVSLNSTSNTGGGGAHSNTQPWIALNYIIYAGV